MASAFFNVGESGARSDRLNPAVVVKGTGSAAHTTTSNGEAAPIASPEHHARDRQVEGTSIMGASHPYRQATVFDENRHHPADQD